MNLKSRIMEKNNFLKSVLGLITAVFLSTILFSLFFVHSVKAAGLYFNPSTGNFYKNENFNVGVFVNAEQAANAVHGIISFPTEYLEAVSVKSNSNSIIDLWVRKPSFSNSGNFGNVNFEGVVLNPGFTGSNGKILEIVFRVKKEGLAEMNFIESSILANDGLGTNILSSNGKTSFSLLPSRFAPETAQPTENLQFMEQRISEVEQQVKAVEAIKTETGFLSFWFVLPKFIRGLIIVFVGLAALLLSIVVLGFIIIVLTWLWSFAWRRRKKIERRVEAIPHKASLFAKRIARDVKFAERELEGDIKYGVRQIKKDFIEAETNKSFKKTLKDYWKSLVRIFRRFTTKNIP